MLLLVHKRSYIYPYFNTWSLKTIFEKGAQKELLMIIESLKTVDKIV